MSRLTTPLLEKVRDESLHDWKHSLGDSRLLAHRVLMRKLIALDDPAVDALLAAHYGVPAAVTKSVPELPAGVLGIEISRN